MAAIRQWERISKCTCYKSFWDRTRKLGWGQEKKRRIIQVKANWFWLDPACLTRKWAELWHMDVRRRDCESLCSFWMWKAPWVIPGKVFGIQNMNVSDLSQRSRKSARLANVFPELRKSLCFQLPATLPVNIHLSCCPLRVAKASSFSGFLTFCLYLPFPIPFRPRLSHQLVRVGGMNTG